MLLLNNCLIPTYSLFISFYENGIWFYTKSIKDSNNFIINSVIVELPHTHGLYINPVFEYMHIMNGYEIRGRTSLN